jgi:hypothetical protein
MTRANLPFAIYLKSADLLFDACSPACNIAADGLIRCVNPERPLQFGVTSLIPVNSSHNHISDNFIATIPKKAEAPTQIGNKSFLGTMQFLFLYIYAPASSGRR